MKTFDTGSKGIPGPAISSRGAIALSPCSALIERTGSDPAPRFERLCAKATPGLRIEVVPGFMTDERLIEELRDCRRESVARVKCPEPVRFPGRLTSRSASP